MLRGKIPKNIKDAGQLFGGTINFTNAIDAIVGFLVVFYLNKYVLKFLPLMIHLTILFLLAILVIILALIGVDGDSISTYLKNYFYWKKNKNKYIYKIPRPEKEIIQKKTFLKRGKTVDEK